MRRLALLVVAASWALCAPAHADDAWAGLDVIDDAALDDLRGGFTVGGVEIGFGATVTTYSGGAMALTTQLTWTDTGLVVAEAVGNLGQTLASLTPEQRSAMGLDGIAGDGVVIADDAGVTALVHNVTESALQNIILNTASGRDLSQNVDVTITLPGFESVQAGLRDELLGIRIADDLSSVLIGAGS